MLKKIILVFLISMLPIIELRGAIPVGAVGGFELSFDLAFLDGLASLPALPWWINYPICVLGNFLPVPFILLFIRRIIEWMKHVKFLNKIAFWLEKKAQKHSAKIMTGVATGLFLFVAIPLPGTGAWTGALVAALFGMKKRMAMPTILLGVMAAGVIMTLGSYGVVGAFKFFI